jgi:hypothetical protein
MCSSATEIIGMMTAQRQYDECRGWMASTAREIASFCLNDPQNVSAIEDRLHTLSDELARLKELEGKLP